MNQLNNLIRWFTEHTFASNLLMLLIAFAAIFSFQNIPKQIFPDVEFQGFFIASVFPGASPHIIEKDVCIPIENSIRDIDNIKKVESLIKKNACSITVHIKSNTVREQTLKELQTSLGSISSLPAGASTPKVTSAGTTKYTARLIISGNTDISNLYNFSHFVIDELAELGLDRVSFEQEPDIYTLIEIPREQLQKHRLSLLEIAEIIKKNNRNISSGEIENDSGKITIQSLRSIDNQNKIEQTIVRSYPNGAQLTLKDIASIKNIVQSENQKNFFDRQPSINLIVEQGNKSISQASNIINQYISDKQDTLPERIRLNIDSDASVFFNARINMLGENAIFGLILVFLILFLFLSFRLALWVSLGIPIAFAGALFVLYALGGSLNMISTFSFLLVLGIIVDDAIVVSESIYTQQQHYIRGKQGAITGATLVSRPVFFAVITSIIMFIPLFFIPGSNGVFISAIPIVAISALVFSLIECFFILPAHLSSERKTKHLNINLPWVKAIKLFFNTQIKTTYRSILNQALTWRYSLVAIFTIIFFFSVALLASGWIKTRLISTIESDEAFARIELTQGSPFSMTQTFINKLETAAFELKKELRDKYGSDQIQHIRTQAGFVGDHTAMIFLTFPSRDERKISTEEVANLWREKVGPLPTLNHLEFSASFNEPGPAINIQLVSKDQNALISAVHDFESLLNGYPAVYGVRNNIKRGNQEVGVKLKPEASQVNVSTQALAAIINQAFHGVYIDSDNKQENKMIVRLPENERNTLWHLERLLIPTPTGGLVPLNRIAELHFFTGETEIVRYNFKRSLNVSAYVDENVSSSSAIIDDIESRFLDNLTKTHPNVSWQPTGALELAKDSTRLLYISFALAILAMYLVLTALFKSLVKPLLVLSAVPFGIVGALIGHWLFGLDVTIWSFAGMIAVSGIVVNDNVVLINFINENISDNTKSTRTAILESGTERFRPIVLTTITTIIGLVPIIFETSWEAQFLIPMVISIAFGELLATIVSLVLIPALYMILVDIENAFNN